jgi:ribosomal protein L7/L12
MFEFFGSVVGALGVLAPVMKNLGELVEGGRRIREFAADILDRFAKKVPPAQEQVVLRQALAQAAAMSPQDFDKKVEAIVEVELAGQSPEQRKAATEYVKLMPARIRATFSRPEDPTGTTAPAKWTAQQPEDLLAILPPRAPLFRDGDSPPEANRWILTERLGIGGFGEVWKAQGRTLKNTFTAFKFCLDPASQQRMFEHEMEIIEQVKNELVDHPHIVKLQDAYLEGPTPWLQYEYIPGGDLGQLAATWPKDLAVRASLAVDVLKTLARTAAHCHELKPAIVHRDFKPGNVLIAKDGKLKITDFGISDTLARQALDEARIATVSGMTCSTPSMLRWAHTPLYASPQQKEGRDSHPADDVHALGVILFQLLLGDINMALGADFRDDLAEQYVCEDLLNVLSRSVAARVERRYQNAGELAEALERLPKKLIVEPITQAFLDKQLYDEIDRRVADAKVKNEAARQQCDRREWNAAIATLESIFHPSMRDEVLYTSARKYRDAPTAFNVVLNGCAIEKKVFVIKVVRELTGQGLAEAKATVEGPPKAIIQGVERAQAELVRQKLEQAGARVSLEPA